MTEAKKPGRRPAAKAQVQKVENMTVNHNTDYEKELWIRAFAAAMVAGQARSANDLGQCAVLANGAVTKFKETFK